MAHLLGSRACIDSLRADVEDLQTVLHELIGKTGSLKCHSWKFPDKLATDVQINDLLQRYQHGKHELDNQVSHIVLFELLIDRLLVVLHGSWRLLSDMETHLSSKAMASASTVSYQTSLSVGLVVKKYWTQLMHLFTVLQQHESQCRRALPVEIPVKKSDSTFHHQHCQTIVTAFSPCSACFKLQECLRHQGQSISDLCDRYTLVSSLSHHRCLTKINPPNFSSEDIDQWIEFQTKDFESLNQQLHNLQTNLSKTKTNLKSSEQQCQKLEETNRRLQQSINDDKQSKKVLQQLHDQKIVDLKKQFDQDLSQLKQEIQSLSKEKAKVEELQEQCRLKDKQIEELEMSKMEMKVLMQERAETHEKIKHFEDDRIRLQTELDVLKRDLDDRQRELQKERTRIENFIRQEQNSQTKQQTLISSVGELSQECQTLKEKISELELRAEQKKKNSSTVSREMQSDLSLPTSTSTHLLVDLQNQMRANELQMELLRQQNESLKFTAEKFSTLNGDEQKKSSSRRYSYGQESTTTRAKPTPLFLLNNEIIEQQAFTETRSVSRPNRWYSSETADVIPLNQPSLQMPLAVKSNGTIRSQPRTTAESRRETSMNKSARAVKSSPVIFCCPTCSKSYEDKRNYDIHKLYCRA